jgi:hypothetical protein
MIRFNKALVLVLLVIAGKEMDVAIASPDLLQDPATIARAGVYQLSHLLASERERHDGTLRYREASVIETLLYRLPAIQKSVAENQAFGFSFSKKRKFHFEPQDRTLAFQSPRISVSVRLSAANLETEVIRRNPFGKQVSRQSAVLELDGINKESLDSFERSLNAMVRKSRGFSESSLLNHNAALDHSKSDPGSLQPSEILLDVKEKWIENGDFDRSPWAYSPVKLVSWPLQKIFYDLPAMATGFATESVTRSPGHNLSGAWDELRGAWKLIRNASRDLVTGIIDPTTAKALDGTLELLDASLKVGNSVLGVAKAGISTIAYPIFRAAGGKKSQRVALRGKRAVIVLIDSELGSDIGTGIIDTYGEEIIRSKLKSIADYYCVRSSIQDNDIDACIRGIPANIQYLDIVSLQHSGGGEEAEIFMKKAVAMKNVKPELLLSIGCYDEPSRFVDAENSMGQERSSWAVHYYLANMLEKRLRGISAVDAANQAYGESFVTNVIDPVSWAAVILIGTQMEDHLQHGFTGSRPSVVTPDSVVRKTIIDLDVDANTNPWQQQKIVKLREFHMQVEALLAEGKITLRKRTLRMLRDSELKMERIAGA